jgi:hypothetical protein
MCMSPYLMLGKHPKCLNCNAHKEIFLAIADAVDLIDLVARDEASDEKIRSFRDQIQTSNEFYTQVHARRAFYRGRSAASEANRLTDALKIKHIERDRGHVRSFPVSAESSPEKPSPVKWNSHGGNVHAGSVSPHNPQATMAESVIQIPRLPPRAKWGFSDLEAGKSRIVPTRGTIKGREPGGAPGVSASGGSAPEGSVPTGSTLTVSTPKESVCGGSVPGGSVPKGTATKENAPQGSVPGGSAIKRGTPKGSEQQAGTPEKDIPRGGVPGWEMLSTRNPSRGSTPSGSQYEGTMSEWELTHRESTSKGNTPRNNEPAGSKSGGNKSAGSKSGGSTPRSWEFVEKR